MKLSALLTVFFSLFCLTSVVGCTRSASPEVERPPGSVPAAIPSATATPASSRPHIVVVLDPGHGGRELGAVDGGVVERDSNRDVAHRVRDLIEQRGVGVVITREAISRAQIDADQTVDAAATFVDLQARVVAANATHARVFVSIHSNAWIDSESRGIEVYFNAQRPFSMENRRLAEGLLSAIEANTRSSGVVVSRRGVFEDTEFSDAAGRQTPFFVLGPEREVSREELLERGIAPRDVGLADGEASLRTQATEMPGALLELLYVSNASDAALLQDAPVRESIARGIAEGILVYLR